MLASVLSFQACDWGLTDKYERVLCFSVEFQRLPCSLYSLLFQDHMANCKYAPVDCIAGCGQKIQRRKISDHVKKDCVKRWVKCPGCKKETTFERLQVRTLLDHQHYFPSVDDLCPLPFPSSYLLQLLTHVAQVTFTTTMPSFSSNLSIP